MHSRPCPVRSSLKCINVKLCESKQKDKLKSGVLVEPRCCEFKTDSIMQVRDSGEEERDSGEEERDSGEEESTRPSHMVKIYDKSPLVCPHCTIPYSGIRSSLPHGTMFFKFVS
jgi:hypothetical protein